MFSTKTARTAKGISQKKLAEELGIEQATVSAWECGIATPPASRLASICEVLGCTLDDLFAEEEDDEDSSAENAPRAEA